MGGEDFLMIIHENHETKDNEYRYYWIAMSISIKSTLNLKNVL
jgi:hypothetical protein